MAALLPFAFCRERHVLLLEGSEGTTLLYTNDTPPEALLEVQRQCFPASLGLQQVDEETFQQQLTALYTGQASTSLDAAQEIIADDTMALDDVVAQLDQTLDLLDSEESAPVIRLLNAILADAIRQGASDVHIEPYEQQLRVRFRIDGHLRTALTLKPKLAPFLTARVKVLARLDIAEKRQPQDGRIAIRLGGHLVDLRVSTLPAAHGERVVMRLLDKQAGLLSLDQLGLLPEQRTVLEERLAQPHGVLLVTGPTGSGKTTTLYAALNHLNQGERNIMTVEDPVEYELPGISQTQVNPRAGLTFASGLRAILRQDPDIVMIGEIRDQETADIAIQASLTGHLVLSTLHTNTAVGAVSRLRDMGVEPYLLASGLIGVMAQRLVRRLCSHCKQPDTVDAALAARSDLTVGEPLWRPVGCEQCHHTGYAGRRALFEVIPVDATLRQMIHDGRNDDVLAEYAARHWPTLAQSGWQAVRQGDTSAEEVLRVVSTTQDKRG